MWSSLRVISDGLSRMRVCDGLCVYLKGNDDHSVDIDRIRRIVKAIVGA